MAATIDVMIIPYPAEPDQVQEEWGVLYPDGAIDWELHGFGPRYENIQTREGQKKIQEEWDARRNQFHATDGGRLRFVKRTITTSFSLPEIARPISQK